MSNGIERICANCWHIQHVKDNTYDSIFVCNNKSSAKYNEELFLGEECSSWVSLREELPFK